MNYLFICMDSCGYKSYVDANTPNFDRVGEPRIAYSPAAYTLPSMYAYLVNSPPFNIGLHKLIRNLDTTDNWIALELRSKGYYTALLSPNPWLHRHATVFKRGFDCLNDINWNHEWAADHIIDRNITIFTTIKKPKFVFNLFMATHLPYRYNSKHGGASQIQAVQSVDTEFGRLLPYLKDTQVTIFADHGDLIHAEAAKLGVKNGKAGHHPGVVPWDERLYKIPFVRGYIE